MGGEAEAEFLVSRFGYRGQRFLYLEKVGERDLLVPKILKVAGKRYDQCFVRSFAAAAAVIHL